MKESYREGPASRPDPESCVGDRKVAGEALTGVHPGQPSNCVISRFGVSAEAMEGRRSTKGNTLEPAASWTQSQQDGLSGLRRVREVRQRVFRRST